MKRYNYLLLTAFALFMNPSCKMLEPEDDNHNTLERVYKDPTFAEGLLLTAYTVIPTNDYRYDEVATDDAVTNDRANSYLRIANGEWSPRFNPQDIWTSANRGILYINQFLSVVNEVPWKWSNPAVKDLYIRKFKGESYALRAMLKYFLLRNHGGVGDNGTLLGTPIYDQFVNDRESFESPRPTFEESMNSINADIAEALKYLPLDYGNVSALPAGFEGSDITDYNDVFGDYSQQRMSGRHALAIKARLALLAASPAFNLSNNAALWQNAATITGDLLTQIGGIDGIDPKGHQFYLKAQVDEADITTGNKLDNQEMLWRRPIYTDRARETSNFPPSLYGSGRINPTQNLVDAFPTSNGYPISDPKSKYDPSKPYENRDPRLGLYIVFNGSKLKNTVINTSEGSGDNGIEAMPTSTRTGYYLKKLLREDVNVNPNSVSNQKHYNTHIRYTELYLNYAEAANEAWGPEGAGSIGFSAKDVIAGLRKRAGIEQPDAYLASITSKDAMRTLIRNERRLELCFEGFRFWDLRRWKENLSEPAKGVRINASGTFNYFNVEERAYNNDFMHYGPIPEIEIIKFGFIQNKGWN